MQTEKNQNIETKVITGMVRFSYLHVFEPYAMDDSQEKKYSVSLIIPKTDKDTLKRIKRAVEAATELAKAKSGGKLPAKFKLPLNDGDIERSEDDAYEGSYYLNANCKTKPGVVDKNLNPIIEPDELYSGCYGRASISFYPFDTSGNRGIACGLNNIQKLKDGEPLGGRASAEDDFAEPMDLEDEDIL